jgi:hypothetical protein
MATTEENNGTIEVTRGEAILNEAMEWGYFGSKLYDRYHNNADDTDKNGYEYDISIGNGNDGDGNKVYGMNAILFWSLIGIAGFLVIIYITKNKY